MSSLLFLFVGIVSLIIAFIIDGGSPGALLAGTAALIVFGGTIGAVGISFPMEDLKKVPSVLKIAFSNKNSSLLQQILFFRDIAFRVRKDGLLSLENEISNNSSIDSFTKKGLEMAIDGIEPNSIRSVLELEAQLISERHSNYAAIFESAGGFAPTMGIIGTVMGLVHVLSNLSDPNTLGPKIAVAFIATLYGVSSANLIWLPIGQKLKNLDAIELNEHSLVIEAITLIQEGENPNFITQKLKGFVNVSEASKLDIENN